MAVQEEHQDVNPDKANLEHQQDVNPDKANLEKTPWPRREAWEDVQEEQRQDASRDKVSLDRIHLPRREAWMEPPALGHRRSRGRNDPLDKDDSLDKTKWAQCLKI